MAQEVEIVTAEPREPSGESFSLTDLFNLVLDHWKAFCLILGASMALGCLYTFTRHTTYNATMYMRVNATVLNPAIARDLATEQEVLWKGQLVNTKNIYLTDNFLVIRGKYRSEEEARQVISALAVELEERSEPFVELYKEQLNVTADSVRKLEQRFTSTVEKQVMDAFFEDLGKEIVQASTPIEMVGEPTIKAEEPRHRTHLMLSTVLGVIMATGGALLLQYWQKVVKPKRSERKNSRALQVA